MRKIFLFFLLACGYTGHAQKQGYYTNPILAGFYPDPSICRLGNNYYLVIPISIEFGVLEFHES